MKPTNSLLFAVLVTMVAHGQDLLKPIVVTASRLEQEDDKVPYAIEKISSTELDQSKRRTLPEAFQYTPGVLVQKTATGHGSPFIRGFTGRQNLLLVDGIRMNNSTWRSGPIQYWNTVDSYALDRMELIKSQGSVIYGSDAIGGTLNAFTKSSNFREQEDGTFFTHGAAQYEYRSNGEGGHVARLENSIGVGGRYGLHVGITRKDFGDIEDSAVGLMKGTGYEENAFDLRFDAAIAQDTTLTFASQYVDQDDISRWHRTLNNLGWTHGDHVAAPGRWVANDFDQERSLTYLRIEQEIADQGSWLNKWTATLSYQTSRDSEYQDRRPSLAALPTSSNYQQRQDADVNTYGFDLTLESQWGVGTFMYGVDFYHDDVETVASRNGGAGWADRPGARPVADDATYDLLGAFGQYSWTSWQRWEISAGARFTYARAAWGAYRAGGSAVDTSGESSWTDLSGSVRVSYELKQDWSLYGGISQSFRAPNLSDLTGNSASMSGLDQQGSPDVDPEKYITYELGTRGQITDSVTAQGSIFYSMSEDSAISTYVDGSSTFVVNADDSYIYGVEGELAWQINDQWLLSGYAAWQEGKTTNDFRTPAERWQTRLLPFTAAAALRWTATSQAYWIEGRVTGAVAADRIHAADQAADNQRIPTNGTPAYLVPAIYAGWKATDNLELSLGLENISDSDYRVHGSGNNEAGFNAILGAKVTW